MITPAGAEPPPASRKRSRNRRGEGARLRVELIEAAARLLESAGDAHALTLSAVAREAGIAAPSIYRHFSDRGELVEAVVADRFQRLDDVLVDAMTGAADPATALRACCDAYCRFGLDHPGHYQVLFGARLALDPARSGDRPGERVYGRLVDAVRACTGADSDTDVHADTGAAPQPDAYLMATNLWVALHGIVSLRTSRPHHPWPPVDTLVTAAISGQVTAGQVTAGQVRQHKIQVPGDEVATRRTSTRHP